MARKRQSPKRCKRRRGGCDSDRKENIRPKKAAPAMKKNTPDEKKRECG